MTDWKVLTRKMTEKSHIEKLQKQHTQEMKEWKMHDMENDKIYI